MTIAEYNAELAAIPKCNCENCVADRMKTPIYGKIELENGLIMKWLRFVDSRLPRADAEARAIELATWKGATVRCWVETPLGLN